MTDQMFQWVTIALLTAILLAILFGLNTLISIFWKTVEIKWHIENGQKQILPFLETICGKVGSIEKRATEHFPTKQELQSESDDIEFELSVLRESEKR